MRCGIGNSKSSSKKYSQPSATAHGTRLHLQRRQESYHLQDVRSARPHVNILKSRLRRGDNTASLLGRCARIAVHGSRRGHLNARCGVISDNSFIAPALYRAATYGNGESPRQTPVFPKTLLSLSIQYQSCAGTGQ